MLELLAAVVPLGIGAALTPSLLCLQILTTARTPWVAKALAVLLGVATAFGIATVALLLGFAQLPHGPGSAGSTTAVVRLVAAGALAVVAVVLFRPHPGLEQRAEAAITRHVDHAGIGAFFTLAFALSIKDVSSFVLLVPAMHDIATSSEPVPVQAACVLLVFVLALMPVLGPPLYRLVRRGRAAAEMAGLYRFVMDRQLQIAGLVAVVFAAYLALTGVRALLGA